MAMSLALEAVFVLDILSCPEAFSGVALKFERDIRLVWE
jgi:hypothetical protein